MRLSHKQLINLPTYVEDGTFLGHVVGFDLDVERHSIATYYIGRHKLVNDLLNTLVGTETLQVAPHQVKSVSSKKMIVYSTAITTAEMRQFGPLPVAGVD